jgi:hypothetical protein
MPFRPPIPPRIQRDDSVAASSRQTYRRGRGLWKSQQHQETRLESALAAKFGAHEFGPMFEHWFGDGLQNSVSRFFHVTDHISKDPAIQLSGVDLALMP